MSTAPSTLSISGCETIANEYNNIMASRGTTKEFINVNNKIFVHRT